MLFFQQNPLPFKDDNLGQLINGLEVQGQLLFIFEPEYHLVCEVRDADGVLVFEVLIRVSLD